MIPIPCLKCSPPAYFYAFVLVYLYFEPARDAFRIQLTITSWQKLTLLSFKGDSPHHFILQNSIIALLQARGKRSELLLLSGDLGRQHKMTSQCGEGCL